MSPSWLLSAEGRIELWDGSTVQRPANGGGLAQSLRRAILQTSSATGIAKEIAKGLLGERTTSLTRDEGQVAAWSRIESLHQYRQDPLSDACARLLAWRVNA